MNQKIVESRNYKYLVILVIQVIILFGIVSYIFQHHSELYNESASYYRQMIQQSPNDNYWLTTYSGLKDKEIALEWNFLITLIVISIFYILASLFFIKKSKNETEKMFLVIWIIMSVFLLIYAGNGNLINELFYSEIFAQFIFLFLSIPLIIKTIFETFLGERILESDLKLNQSINSYNSKLNELKGLLETGIITETEFEEKSEHLHKNVVSERVENDKEFIEIKSRLSKAVESGLLTQEVADAKLLEFREKLLIRENTK